jgi:hypothetical protein
MTNAQLLPLVAGVGPSIVLGVTPHHTAAADCPTAVLFEPSGTGTTMDTGWTGYAHAQPVFGTTLHLGVSCTVSSPPCGSCTVTGVVANLAGHRQRCQNDTSIEYTVATEVAAGVPETKNRRLSRSCGLLANGSRGAERPRGVTLTSVVQNAL